MAGSVTEEAQKLSKSAYVELFRMDASRIGGPIMFFCQSARHDGVVRFGGVPYTPVDVSFTGMETSAGGPLPRPRIQVAATNGVFHGVINTYGDLHGCVVQRIRTFARFLDGSPDADPTQYVGPDTYRVARKIIQTPTFIEWELAANVDQQGVQIPGRPVIRDTCLWRYRSHVAGTNGFDYSKVQCPYAGSRYYDEANNPVADPAKDKCSRKVSGCELRFGKGERLPFGGFPGSARVRQ